MPEAEHEKVSKQATLYVYQPGTRYECADCSMYLAGKKRCELHCPDDVIQPWGSCGFFVYGKPHAGLVPRGGVTKTQSGYVENPEKEGYSCKRCEYFVPGAQDCEIVDRKSPGDTPGKIHPNGCCNAWEREEEEVKGKAKRRLADLIKPEEEEED